MPKTNSFACTIFLNNGEKIKFSGDADDEKRRNFGSRLEKLMSANFLAFDLGGKLNVIPTQSILRIEIEPAPNVIVSNTIKDVKPIS